MPYGGGKIDEQSTCEDTQPLGMPVSGNPHIQRTMEKYDKYLAIGLFDIYRHTNKGTRERNDDIEGPQLPQPPTLMDTPMSTALFQTEMTCEGHRATNGEQEPPAVDDENTYIITPSDPPRAKRISNPKETSYQEMRGSSQVSIGIDEDSKTTQRDWSSEEQNVGRCPLRNPADVSSSSASLSHLLKQPARTQDRDSPIPVPPPSCRPVEPLQNMATPSTRSTARLLLPSPATVATATATQNSQQYATNSFVKFEVDPSAAKDEWTDREHIENRRVVDYRFKEEKAVISICFSYIDPLQESPNDSRLSCIWWAEKEAHFVTSNNVYRLLQHFIRCKLTTEDVDYIRKRLKRFELLRSSPELWKIISCYSNPQSAPARSTRLYSWEILNPAVEEIIGECVRNPAIDGYIYHRN